MVYCGLYRRGLLGELQFCTKLFCLTCPYRSIKISASNFAGPPLQKNLEMKNLAFKYALYDFMISNISRLEQDIVDDHRLLIHTSSGMGHPFPSVPSLFSVSISFSFSSSLSGGSMPSRYGDGSCGRGAAKSRWKARPSVLIGFVIGMLN